MGNLTLNGQTVLTQVGTNRPEFGAGVPSGTIIQTVIKNERIGNGTLNNGDELVGNSNTITSTFYDLSITTKHNNSKIHLVAQSPYVYTETATGAEIWFVRNPNTDNVDINRPADGTGYIIYGSSNHGGSRTIIAYDIPNVSANTTLKYVIRFKRYSGSNAVWWVYDRGGFGVFTITEIAA